MNSRIESTVDLWHQGSVPGALGTAPEDTPTITPYWPKVGTGASIVIFPGGGYGGLAAHEGEGYALWLAERGIAAFVVKYRLGTHGYRHPVMAWDAARAVRYVRYHAVGWGLDPSKIGVMGSSAGGHLVSTAITQFDGGDRNALDPIERESSRPDVAVLCYPVISMGEYTNHGSKKNLLGEDPSEDLVERLSSEKQVRCDTPPCFLFHTWEDGAVVVENALLFASALREKGVRFDLHVYERGGHGMGLGKRSEDSSDHHPWTEDLLFWLSEQKFL